MLAFILFSGCETGIPPQEVAELYYNLGNAYFDLDEFDSAVNAYLNALALDGSLPQAGYNLARVYIESGNVEKGMAALEDLLKDDPGNSVLLSTVAWAYHELGDYQSSYEFYQEILQRTPTNEDGLYNAAVVAWKLDKKDESLDYYRRLHKENEEDEVLYRIATILIALGRWEEAIRELLIYVDSNPDDGDAYFDLGLAYTVDRSYGEALAAFDKAIEQKEDDPMLYFEKAVVLLLFIENIEEGLLFLDKAVEAGFGDAQRISELLAADEMLFSKEVSEFFDGKGLLPEEESPDQPEAFDSGGETKLDDSAAEEPGEGDPIPVLDPEVEPASGPEPGANPTDELSEESPAESTDADTP
ncbi:MAG: tetratricopeptide repeat protein, partial [Spirochaetales bacterium]|jgi:tetratricopeptide (TPR) repeat protein|nr:tetratricopeptide repeat protein [Spirochaetales bacterium]